MQKIVTEKYGVLEIKNGWFKLFLDLKIQCNNCLREFGPLDDDTIDLTGKNGLGWICGSCCEKLAAPHLEVQNSKEKANV